MSNKDTIHEQIEYIAEIRTHLNAIILQEGPDLLIEYDQLTSKYVLLAMASRIERELGALIDSIALEFPQHQIVCAMRNNKVGARSFFTLFRWEANNANHFYRKFGDTFLSYMREQSDADEDLPRNASSLIRIVRLRNSLIHNDLATYRNPGGGVLEIDEVTGLYRQAMEFIDSFKNCVWQFVQGSKEGE